MSIQRREILAAAVACAATYPVDAISQTRTPLLMEGKKTLYQRVLTRPEARIVAKPGDTSGKVQSPFTVFFVYGRVQEAGNTWIQVGATSDGRIDGFIQETQTTAWQHMITLAFASPTTRERVLFFRERAGVIDFINGSNPAEEASRILGEIKSKGKLEASHKVIAAEPDRYVDLQKSFYLLPVLEASSALLKSGHRARIVKVASVTAENSEPEKPGKETGIANFNAAVVFVIDATSSMQPYIDRTRSTIDMVLRQAEAAKLTDRIRFGLVAFQDDPSKTKGMEYLSRVFADPNKITSREQFMSAVNAVKATKNSTRAYAEDGYAAVDDALKSISWNRFGGRYIIYISDASAREGNSPLAASGLSTQQLRTSAQERGVAVYAVHLKTNEGKSDHAQAEAQYKRLTDWPGKGPLYFPVNAGDPEKFEADIRKMSMSLVEQVKSPQSTMGNKAESQSDAMTQSLNAVGRAMVLAYLGRQQGVKSPPMYEAWAVDRDVRNREIPSFTVRVLLTKNQLSDLQSTVKRLADAYERSQLDPANFFNQIRSAAAAMGRDPTKLSQGKAKNLEQAGLMAEYLEGLPYQSPLMSMSFDTWKNMSVGQQQSVVDNLRSLVALYQRFHDDSDRWVRLNNQAPEGDKVYPVPIDSLP